MNGLLYFIVVISCLKLAKTAVIPGEARNNTLTLGFILPWHQNVFIGQAVGSAMILGVEEVYRRGILPGYDIQWVWRDSYCEPRRGMRMAVDIVNSVEDLDGIIGCVCSVVSQPVALLAASWGIPMVSWASTSISLSDKTTYPTFSRTDGTWATIGSALREQAKLFNWDRFGIISSPADIMKLTANAIAKELRQNGHSVFTYVVGHVLKGEDVDQKAKDAQINILRAMKQNVRIIVTLFYPVELRQLMANAQELGMLNGGFTFIGPLFESVMVTDPLFDGYIGIGNRQVAGPSWDKFLHDVFEAFENPIFNGWDHIGLDGSISDIDPYSGMILYLCR